MKNIFFKEENSEKTIMVSHSVYFADNYFGCQHRCNVSANDFGKVRTMNISIVTDHQQQLNATLYIPQNASAENKVPLVITSSGWEDAGESWSYVATELSRRGIAVANMEPYSHGTSGMFYQKGEMALYTNMYSDGMGMVALTDYLTSGILDFIDTDKVGVTGLSMGGICTLDNSTTLWAYV